jgi:superoxide dismutase, Cu-Zn family
MHRVSVARAARIGALCAVVPFAASFAQQPSHDMKTMPMPAAPTQAIAVLSPASGSNCKGVVRFTQDGEKVKVVADLEGLTAGQQHAIHVHEFGDCSAPDATSAGSHYNPENHPHGLVANPERHAGDLGNLQADANGKAHYEVTITNASIAGAKNPILGRAVIVHAKVDDGGQPVGNAGARIACGVIGVMKAPETK